jgi:homocysteine S-methyltransferase
MAESLAAARKMTKTADPIARFLEGSPVIILDGALATELERRGADLDDPLWSAKILLERPELIRDVHRDYFAAGADVATSASYQASMEGFARHGIDAQGAAALMRESVALACAAREHFWAVESNRVGRRRPLVAASVGPYGAMLADGSEYRGGYAADDEALARHHRPRLAALAGSGADLLAFETLPSLREALVLARLLGEFPGTFAWLSFSCRDGLHTSEGDDIGDCVARLRGFAQVIAVGINCTAPRHVAALLGRMRAADQPLLAYPNSGECYDAGTRRWRGSGGFAAGDAQEWYHAGARLIGGCCRTTPDHIRALRSWAGVLARRG